MSETLSACQENSARFVTTRVHFVDVHGFVDEIRRRINQRRFWRDPLKRIGAAFWTSKTWRHEAFNLSFSGVRRTIPKSTWAEIKTAFATGTVSLRELARQMNIPTGTVLARAKREGWTREIHNAKALTKPENAPLAVTPVEAVAMSMQQRGERQDAEKRKSAGYPTSALSDL